MAADFNAGSIEGTLDLDTAPFAAGLNKAKMQAADFEHKKVSPKATLDDDEFKAKKDIDNAELDKLGAKKVTSKADLDISEALAKYAILSKVLDAGGLGKASTGPSLLMGKFIGLAGAIMSVAAAAGPAGAALLGLSGAAATAMVSIAGPLALFSKVLTSDFSKIQAAAKANKQLAGSAGLAETAYKHLTSAWTQFQKKAGGVGFKVLTDTFNGLTHILPLLVPLLRTVGNGVDGIVKRVMALAHTKAFETFLTQLQHFMHGFLQGAGPVIASLLSTYMHAFEVLRPLMSDLGHGIEAAVHAAHGFVTGGGLATFVSYARKSIPEVIRLVGDLVHTLGNIGKGIAPLAQPALHFIDALVKAVGKINLAPFARGFGAVLNAAKPLLPVLANLINVVLKPLGQLLGHLAHGSIAPLAHSLKSELQPAFHSLSSILKSLAKPIAAFLGSIANLANPTGVKLVSSLLKALAGTVKELAGPLSHLVVILESVIDNGIKDLLPAVKPLGGVLHLAGKGAVVLANGLAAILSHKTVVYTLLGIYGAVKSLMILGTVTSSLKGFVGVMKTFMELQKAEGFMAAIAATAPKLAAGMDLIGVAIDFMMGPWGLLILAVSALVIGFIEAWKHSKTFRDIVMGALHAVADAAKTVFNWLKNAVSDVINFIKDHWQLLLGIFLGPMVAIVALVISHWSQIKSFITNVMTAIVDWCRARLQDVVNFFSSLPGKILSFIGRMVSAGRSFFGGVFDGIKQVGSEILSWCEGLPAKIISAIGNIGSMVWSHVTGSISSALSGIGNFITDHIPGIPHHALGGVTVGPHLAMVGDNPGGHEAIIPLDKYHLPTHADAATRARVAQAQAQDTARRLDQLIGYVKALLEKPTGTDKPIDVSDKSLRRLQQIVRAT